MKTRKMYTYTIKRYVVETYEVHALDRKEAKLLASMVHDPSSVIVLKEVFKKQK